MVIGKIECSVHLYSSPWLTTDHHHPILVHVVIECPPKCLIYFSDFKKGTKNKTQNVWSILTTPQIFKVLRGFVYKYKKCQTYPEQTINNLLPPTFALKLISEIKLLLKKRDCFTKYILFFLFFSNSNTEALRLLDKMLRKYDRRSTPTNNIGKKIFIFDLELAVLVIHKNWYFATNSFF